MPSTYTSNIRLEEIEIGGFDNTWGTRNNANFTRIDEAISGMASIATTGGTTVLTTNNGSADQARMAIIKVTGTLVSNATLTIPDKTKNYIVQNSTSGAFTVTVKASGTGAVIPQGGTFAVMCDGTDTTLVSVGKLLTDLDANSKKITNLATPTAAADAATKGYADGLFVAAGNLPPGGTVGQILKKNSGTNFDASWVDPTEELPDQTGNNGKFLTTNGTNVSWATTSEVPINSLVAFDSATTGNTVTVGNATYLKTGVIAPAATYLNAQSAPYATVTSKTVTPSTIATEFGAASETSYYGNARFASSGSRVVFLLTSSRLIYTDDGYAWTTVTGLPTTFASVVYGNGLFVATSIATTNNIYTSTDGVTWTTRTAALPASANWNALGFGNGVFVTHATTAANAARSTDGITWTAATTALTHNCDRGCKIEYGNGVFVYAGITNGAAATSTDGTSWTARTYTAFDIGASGGLVFGSGLFVKIGDDSSGVSVRTSSDGVTWTNRTAGPSQGGGIVYHNGRFYAGRYGGGGQATSTDGITWTTTGVDVSAVSVSGGFNAAISTPYGFAVAADSNDYLLYSWDGKQWGRRGTGVAARSHFVTDGAGLYGALSSNDSSCISFTKDGLNYAQQNIDADFSAAGLSDIAYYDSKWWAHSSTGSELRNSSDRITWSAKTAAYAGAYLQVANNRLWAFNTSNDTTIKWTLDGTTWNTATGLTGNAHVGIAYGNGTYVVWSTASNGCNYSTDGTTFTQIPTGNALLVVSNVVHDGTYFWAVNTAGSIFRSTDGITWAAAPRSYRSAVTAGGSTVALLSGNPAVVVGGANLLMKDANNSLALRVLTATANNASAGMPLTGTNFIATISSGAAYRLDAAANQVLNDVNLKTYNATATEQTDFYKRVS